MDERREAIEQAKEMGPSGIDDPVQRCNDCPQTMIERVQVCSGGMYQKAQDVSRAVHGHAIRIVDDPRKRPLSVGGPTRGVSHTRMDTGQINIYKGPDVTECSRAQILVFELHNMAQTQAFRDIGKRAQAGKVDRKTFILENERLEYNSAIGTKSVVKQCQASWCCTDKQVYDWANPPFEEYFKKLATDHKEYYGQHWDKNFKEAYEKANPAP